MSQSLRDRLQARGYRIDEEEMNARGRLRLVVSGPELDRFPLYQTDAEALADGRVTPDELMAARGRVAQIKGGL